MNDPRLLHAATVHVPVAAALLGVPLVAWFALRGGRDGALRWTVVALYLGLAVAAFLAERSGAGARALLGDVAPAGRALVERHARLAGWVGYLALVPAGAALGVPCRVRGGTRVALAACLAGALACAGWVGLVGHLGGTAVYAFGAGTPHPVRAGDAAGEADDPASADPRAAHFRDVVRPLLAARCMGCHGPAPYGGGGLDLTTARGALAGGGRGPAIVPGDFGASLLGQVVTGAHPTLRMPLDGPPLGPADVAALRTWIEGGAAWPADPPRSP